MERLFDTWQRADIDHERRTRGGRRMQRGGEAGRGPGVYLRSADRVAHKVMQEGRLAEADFGLGRVDVDVDFLRWHFEKEQHDRKRRRRDDVAVRLGERVENEAIADEAAIDEDIDGIAVELLQRGLGDKAGEA